MSELKKCPFCGSKALTNIFLDYEDIENLPTNVIDDYEPEVTCENERCIYGWWLSPKDWNTRPIEDALNARIAELKAFINQLIELGEWGVTGMEIATSFSGGEIHNLAERRQNEWLTLVKDWKEREE